MAKFNLYSLIFFLALFNNIAHTVPVPATTNHTHSSCDRLPHTRMADAWIPIRNRKRGRAFANTGGHGLPRGGRNVVEPRPRLVLDGGSPIATHMSTLSDANSSTDDTIDIFIQVLPISYASHNIIVRQKHVEHSCACLMRRKSPNYRTSACTTFTPDSLFEQRRKRLYSPPLTSFKIYKKASNNTYTTN